MIVEESFEKSNCDNCEEYTVVFEIKTKSKSGRVYQFNLDDIGNKIYVIKEEAEKMLEKKKKNE